jgi:uncharacterized membrane protein YidH (DUF202 family)
MKVHRMLPCLPLRTWLHGARNWVSLLCISRSVALEATSPAVRDPALNPHSERWHETVSRLDVLKMSRLFLLILLAVSLDAVVAACKSRQSKSIAKEKQQQQHDCVEMILSTLLASFFVTIPLLSWVARPFV